MKLSPRILATTLFALAHARALPDNDFHPNASLPLTVHTGQGLPRPADDTLWNQCRIKGCNLLEGMVRPDHEAGQLLTPPRDSAQSPFKDFPDEVIDWGYQYYDVEEQGSEHAKLDDYWGIADALRGLGVSDKTKGKGGNNELVFYTHWDPNASDQNGRIPLREQEYEVEGKDGSKVMYPYTGAYFLLSLNAKDGVIMTMNRKSPKNAAADYGLNIPSDKFPGLSASSDVAWGMWTLVTQQNSASVKNIKYFLCLSITNPSTLKVVARAMNGAILGPWPGKRFWLADEDGKALMGKFALALFAHREYNIRIKTSLAVID
jgi:hypothetical protein